MAGVFTQNLLSIYPTLFDKKFAYLQKRKGNSICNFVPNSTPTRANGVGRRAVAKFLQVQSLGTKFKREVTLFL